MVGVSAILTKAIDVGLFGGKVDILWTLPQKTNIEDWPGDACVWMIGNNMPSWTFSLLRKLGQKKKKHQNSPHKIGVKFSES